VYDPKEKAYVAEYDGVRVVGNDTAKMFRNFRQHQLEKGKT